MNRGLAVSADNTRWPSLRATSLSGGNCSLRLTSADWAPAVERPSSQALSSMMRRKSATSGFLNTSGMQISMPPASPHLGRSSGSDCIRTEARDFRLEAFSLREPVSTPLENALEARRKHHAHTAARRHEHERGRALIQRVVVKLVGDVGDEQFGGPVLVDL